MPNINKKFDYIVIASLFQGERKEVLIGYKEKKILENFYIINKFDYCDENMQTFKILFDIFFSSKRPKEFVDFFVEDKSFYGVFTYTQEENIKKSFSKEFNIYNFDERCVILENILIYFDRISSFPNSIFGCLTEMQNIKIDDQKNISFVYNLKNMEKYSTVPESKDLILKNIRNIIYTLLESESKAKFNKSLHIVLDKCERGVYGSIPELVIDLKKAEKSSKTSTWLKYFKYQMDLKKNTIEKVSKIATVSLIAAGMVYLVYNQLTSGQSPGSAAMVVSIGGVNYNGNKEDESDKNVSSENIDNQTGTKESADIVLSKGLDMEYEDYIVKYGDTVSSICSDYYKDNKYITAVATFNGIDVNEVLTAGTILKLPNRTAMALYSSK